MYISILIILSTIILLRSQSNQSIVINEDGHRRDYTCYEDVDSEVVFVAEEESRAFYVFLNNILILRSINLPCKQCIFLSLSTGICVHLLGFYALLYFKIRIHFFFIFLSFFIQRLSELFNSLMNENTSALTSTFRFANENHSWISFALSLCHYTRFNFLLSFAFFLLGVFLDIVELSRIHPGPGKEVKVIRKLLLKTFEVHTQGRLTANVVHAQKVIHFLGVGQAAKKLRRHARVSPEYIPVIWIPIFINLIFLLFLHLWLLILRRFHICLCCFASILC